MDSRAFLRSFFAKMIFRYENMSIVKGLNSWKEHITLSKLREQAEGVGAKLRAELDALSDEARRAKEQRIRGIITRMMCRSKGVVLNKWIASVTERKRQRHLVNMALQRLKNRIASAAYVS